MDSSSAADSMGWYRIASEIVTALVVIGLLGEYAGKLTDVAKAYWAYPFSFRALIISVRNVAFPLMVVLGVSGELWVNENVSAIEGREAAKNEQLRQHNLAVETILQPRRLLPDGRNERISDALHKFPELKGLGQIRVFIQPIADDSEADALAKDIKDLLGYSSWSASSEWLPQIVREEVTHLRAIDIPPGLRVFTVPRQVAWKRGEPDPNADLFKAGDVLATTLTRAGLTEGSGPVGNHSERRRGREIPNGAYPFPSWWVENGNLPPFSGLVVAIGRQPIKEEFLKLKEDEAKAKTP